MDIVLNGLYKSFEGKMVLQNFSCRLREGRTTCITGPSGVGKTTLLRILMGLEQPDAGTIEGLGTRRLSAVFQEERFCENLTAVRNIGLVLPGRLNRPLIEDELRALSLTDADFSGPVRELSGGMRRRVALARALLVDYDLLLLDEPLKGLDDAVKARVMAHLYERTAGRTVVMVTHDLREAAELGADIITLEEPQ